jgi:hypothetical protein
MTSGPHRPKLPPRPSLVEHDAFDERNNVLLLLLGLISIAERIMSVVPELVEPPKEDVGSHVPDEPVRMLR